MPTIVDIISLQKHGRCAAAVSAAARLSKNQYLPTYRAGLRHARGVRPNRAADFINLNDYEV